MRAAAPGCALLLVALLAGAGPATAAAAGAGGDAGGFVAPYVDTVAEDVEMILDLAGVGPGDYLIDLGAGDGRFVVAAARRGALGHGVELDPALVERARRNAELAGVAQRAAFLLGDIFAADVSRATVVTLYLFPEANLQLRPKLLAELAPGTRLVSNSFHMGDWEPDGRAQGRTSGGALLWIIPARFAGTWDFDLGERQARLRVTQRYQRIDAVLEVDDVPVPVEAATLRGEHFTLVTAGTDGPLTLHGRIDGERLEGTARLGERVLAFEGSRNGEDP